MEELQNQELKNLLTLNYYLRFFEKPIKAKIKQLTTKKLLQEQPFYKQSIKKPRIKKLKNYELLRESPF